MHSESIQHDTGGVEASPPSSVAVIDDHPTMRQALVELLNDEPALAVTGQADSPESAMRLLDRQPADLVVVGVTQSRELRLSLVRRVAERSPLSYVLAMTLRQQPTCAVRAMLAGAWGWVTKDEPNHVILDAAHRVLDGRLVLDRSLLRETCRRFSAIRPSAIDRNELSHTERIVLKGLSAEHGLRRTASELDASVQAVKRHRARLMARFRLRTPVALVCAASNE